MIKVTDDTYENFIKKGNKIKILKLGATGVPRQRRHHRVMS